MMGREETPYDPVDRTDVSKDGMNIGAVVADIHAQRYAVVDNFLRAEQVESIRTAFNTEVLITEMRAIGTATGRTWRAHNLLAKTRGGSGDPRPTLADNSRRDDRQIQSNQHRNAVEHSTRRNQANAAPRRRSVANTRPHPSFLCKVLIAFDDFTEQNGATHIAPCSHGWAHPVDQQAHSLQIELQSGSALFWEGGLWHGGGANTTTDQERMGLFISHQVNYLRPSDLQLLSVPREPYGYYLRNFSTCSVTTRLVTV